MQTITIKPMNPNKVNLKDIVSITQTAFGELLKQNIQTPTAHITIEELQNRHHTHYWCAYDGEKLIGFVNGNLKQNNTFYADIMAVLPNYHCQGIGSRLMSALEETIFSLGVKYIYLDTMLPAKKNIKFYKGRGYLPYSIANYTKRYYSIDFRKYPSNTTRLKIRAFLHYIRSYVYLYNDNIKSYRQKHFSNMRSGIFTFLGDQKMSSFLYYMWNIAHYLRDTKRELFSKKSNTAKYKQEIATLRYILDHAVDITKFPPATGALRDKQLTSLDLLKQIASICQKNSLTYWLDFGTLIGAVRHSGFIPWDDDIDVSMLREDWLKIIPLLKEQFKDSEFIVREALYANFQIRIQNKDNSIGVDIFPVDTIASKSTVTPDTKRVLNNQIQLARKKFHSHFYWHYKNILTRTHAPVNVIALREQAQKITSTILGEKIGTVNKDSILFYGIDFPHDGNNFHPIEYDVVFPLGKIKFEGEYFSCPCQVDKYLKSLYGDYMSFPKNILITH